jgi:hypothetical protein
LSGQAAISSLQRWRRLSACHSGAALATKPTMKSNPWYLIPLLPLVMAMTLGLIFSLSSLYPLSFPFAHIVGLLMFCLKAIYILLPIASFFIGVYSMIFKVKNIRRPVFGITLMLTSFIAAGIGFDIYDSIFKV